jgi:hypothetical protein
MQHALGAEKRIGDLTRDDITVFNNCRRVTTLKSGGAKSQLSVDKSRRVLRLALKWAADSKLIDASPAEPIEADAKTSKRAEKAKADATPAPEAKPTKRGAKKNEPASEPAPAPVEKKRKRKGAIVLEVAQPEAELAADAAEAHIANSTEALA